MTPEYEDFLNHIMSKKCCFAASNRYCAKGADLKLDADARFIADLTDIKSRRRQLKLLVDQEPHIKEAIESRVAEKFAERKQ